MTKVIHASLQIKTEEDEIEQPLQEITVTLHGMKGG